MCLHELSIVDDTLEALGAPKKYQQLHNWIIRIIIGWIVYIVFDLTIIFLNLDAHFFDIYLFFVMDHPEYIFILGALILGTFLGYTSTRFHQVNDCLHVLHSDLIENNADCGRQNKSILVRQQITKIKNRRQCIWILM
ncbi:hypothetical protein ALC60_11499 [Trachymyrmex zeteki]|uniref:Uncharacterized protein n=1 Tax=Mycetomoellerius zeteki TaxID=64791 RepID=A0A151WNE9_9HYME|nr:hypothetical protein ALC60_11499 [Trachymyrmex zeteki]